MMLECASQTEVRYGIMRKSCSLDNEKELIRSGSNWSQGGQHDHTKYTICCHPKHFFALLESRGIDSYMVIDP